MSKPWRLLATALFVLAAVAGSLAGDKLLARSDDSRENLRVYTELVSLAHDLYGTEVSYRELVFASIQGMLRTLDPHTSFLSPRAYTGMRERQQSTFYGLGILVSVRNGQLTVITPIEGTPASRLGIRAGDVISTIEGEPTETLSLDEAVDRLKGPKGTQVHIEIVRRGLDEPLPMTVTRAEIPQTTVRYAYMLNEETGYIWLTDFNRATSDEVARALADLKGRGMKRLVFDLRNNGGGLLDQAIEVADQFVPEDTLIVETRGRFPESEQRFTAAGRYSELGVPVVVLVNRGTASAAEIVSGAIQDHDVGLVVGTPTWGKGLVQTVYNLPYGAGLALTTAKYYTPSGRLIQRDYTSYYEYVTADDQLDPGALVPRGPRGAVFRTDLGREVFGGGGITPDVLVEVEELTPFDQLLLARNSFLNFAVDYSSGHEVASPAWRPGREILDEFHAWLVKEEIATADEAREGLANAGNGDYAYRMLTGEILNARFGPVAQHRALTEGDRQIQRALAMFEKAGELLARREALDNRPPTTPSGGG
jgi:carboxyl-terminal processing protease